MTRIKTGFRMCLICMLLLLAAPAHAHHLWISQSEGELGIARGQFPDGLESYRTAAVKEAAAWDSAGHPLPLTRQERDARVLFRTGAPAALATVRCDWGLRVNTTEGKKLIDRQAAEEQGLTVIEAFFSTQYSKTIFADSPLTTAPTGMLLEIVPVDNLLAAPAGQAVKVQLLFDHQPLTDTVIHFGHRRQARTDRNGIAVIDVSGTQAELIWARHRVPVRDDAQKNFILYTTFLVLAVK
jgi:nickel transport protein